MSHVIRGSDPQYCLLPIQHQELSGSACSDRAKAWSIARHFQPSLDGDLAKPSMMDSLQMLGNPDASNMVKALKDCCGAIRKYSRGLRMQTLNSLVIGVTLI